MRYVVNDHVFCKTSDVKEYILNRVGDVYFKKMIDQKYGEIKIFNRCYKASYIFYGVNRQDYEDKRKNFYKEKGNEIENNIVHMNEFEDIYVYGFKIISIPDN